MVERKTGEWKLDPSIFDVEYGKNFTGSEKNLFGPVGEVTGSGNYFSLNLGFNHLEERNCFVVLDTKMKTLTYRTFEPFYIPESKGQKWKLDLKLLEYPQREVFNGEFFFPLVNDFLFQMKMLIIPEMDEAKGKEVSEALKEACKPLVEYFQKQQKIASRWLELLQKVS
jgi:hypothetical protein